MIELKYECSLDELKEMVQHQAELFDSIYDAILSGVEYIVLNEPNDVTFLMPWERDELITEVVGVEGKEYIHELKAEVVEYIRCFPNLIEIKIWEPVAEALLFNEDAADEYVRLKDIIDFWSINHAYDKAEDAAKELRNLYRALEIIPFADEEMYLLD